MNAKTVVTAVLASAAIASLSGCASMGMGKGDARDLNSNLADDPFDQVYIARVNADAKNHFMEIIWVNPPLKDKTAMQQQSQN